jgi:hypothetical protein
MHTPSQAESRAEFAERAVARLLRDVDKIEDQLAHEKDNYKNLTEEMDQAFIELTGSK